MSRPQQSGHEQHAAGESSAVSRAAGEPTR